MYIAKAACGISPGSFFLLSHLIFLILFLISKNSLAFPIELYYICHMNDGSYVNMIIKNYNSEEVYSMEELEKSKQKSADHEDEEVCCCGHHHHHDEHDDGHEEHCD